MSPSKRPLRAFLIGFPRVSGDEPDAVRRIEQNQEFSPRERG